MKLNFKNKLKIACFLMTAGVSLGLPTYSYANIVPTLIANGKTSLSPIISKVLPSIVSITVVGKITVNQDSDNIPEQFKNLFPDFFNRNSQNNREEQFSAAGSGIIIDANKGYILTNNHVINNATSIKVKLYDGRTFEGKVIGKDSATDLAVVKISDFKDLTSIEIGDSNALKVGDFVIALGNPFGIGLTATSGIISAKNRSTNLNDYENYLQTDAAINKGNSGGALVTLDGKLIGINSAILSPQGGSVGVGFSIPVNMAMNVYKQLITSGHVTRSLLGVKGTNLTPSLIKTLKLPVNKGAFISEVTPNTAASKAGMQAGDVVIGMNGNPIVNFEQLRTLIATLPPQTKIELTIIRNGKSIKTNVLLGSQDKEFKTNEQIQNLSKFTFLGSKLFEKNNQVAIQSLDSNGVLSQFGAKINDIIISINNTDIKNIEQIEKIMKDKPQELIIKMSRNNSFYYIVIN